LESVLRYYKVKLRRSGKDQYRGYLFTGLTDC
jgi:hypothetical protein